MKIALGLEYPLGLRGGVSVLVEELISRLSDRHQIVLVSPDKPEAVSGYPIQKHIYWNPATVAKDTSRELARQLTEAKIQLANLHMGGHYGWGIRFPGHSPFPFLSRSGIRSVSTIHVATSILDGYCGSQKPIWFKLALLPPAWLGKLDELKNVEAEITVSLDGLKKVRRWYWPFRNRFQCIYHSRLKEGFTPAPGREPTILSIGHIAFRKGQHFLVESFVKVASEFPEWKLLLIGHCAEEDYWNQIQKMANDAGLKDRILLMGSRPDAMEFARKAAVYVQPSLFEGLPLALQEAMYCGCACIGTDISGTRELIEHSKTGLLVPPGNPAALATALRSLLKNAELRNQLGASGHTSILQKGMTAKAMSDNYEKLFERVLNQC